MIKLGKTFLILLLSIAVFNSPFFGNTKVSADTLNEVEVNYDFGPDNIQYLPLDPSTIIDLDENPNYTEDPSDYLASCNSKNYSQTSKSGSKILLVGNSSSYGYCHIRDVHMKATGLINHSVGGKSQFYGSYTALGMMNLAMKVINGSNDLHTTNIANRRYKEFYNSFEGNLVRVVIHKGSDWSSYKNYDWIIVTSYPRFKGSITF